MENSENRAEMNWQLTPAERGVTHTVKLGWEKRGPSGWDMLKIFPRKEEPAIPNGQVGDLATPVVQVEAHSMFVSSAEVPVVWGGKVNGDEAPSSGIRRRVDPQAEESKRVFQETQEEIMRAMADRSAPATGVELSRDIRESR